jgi:hypothetical protein
MILDCPINCDALTITNYSEEFSELTFQLQGTWYKGELHTSKHNYFKLDKLRHLTLHCSAKDFTSFCSTVFVLCLLVQIQKKIYIPK